MTVEIEQYIKAEKKGVGNWTLELNTSLSHFVTLLAEEYGLTEIEVVEKLFAGGVDVAFREEEGKQILVKDPTTDGPDKVLRLFKKNSG